MFGNITFAQQEAEVPGSWPGRVRAKAKAFLLFVKVTQTTGGRGQEGGNWPTESPINCDGWIWELQSFGYHFCLICIRLRKQHSDSAVAMFAARPTTPSVTLRRIR